MAQSFVVFIIAIFFTGSAHAEYRVFTLHIENNKSHTVKQVETTLDPEQFVDFYPLKADEKITYVETWRCQGRTDFFKPHCDNPRLNISLELPQKPN